MSMMEQIARLKRVSVLAAAGWLGVAGAMTLPACAQFTAPTMTTPQQVNQTLVPTTDPTVLNPEQHDVVMGPGDLLTVNIFGQALYSPPVRVSVDGSIQLPLIGAVHVTGLTVHQTEDLIAERLKADGMYQNPQITVQLSESVSQYATVTGELHAIVPIIGTRRLLEVLGQAGASNTGVSSQASATQAGGAAFPLTASHVITVIRPGEPKPIVVDLGTDPTQSAKANIIILPHDLIIVSRVGVVYVVGAFSKQGAIALDQSTPLTLLQATALSGGVGFEGRYEDLRIIRTVGLERKFVKVDIKRVMRGKNPDPILQADDIIFLPSNAIKAALKGNALATFASLADLAIIAITQL